MKKDILKTLNSEQKKAVTVSEGPILIVAGAGTGKTRAITTRIAHLLNSKKDLKPENILALTFTDKATNEMRDRVSDIVGHGASDIWIFTFHSFCRKVLSDDGSHIGISSNFKIMDDIEKWIFLKTLLPEFKLDYYLHMADPASVISSFTKFISKAKEELVLPEEYNFYTKNLRKNFEKSKSKFSAEEKESQELELKREEEVARIYDIYQKRSLKENALDFGDLILYTIKLFSNRANILSHYRNQFKYILVDEFQDTNIAQIELLDILAKKNRNICVVGDDDQAIYRFRGASYASFLKFKEKYPNLTTIKLVQNYRSTKKILNSAGRLIQNNGTDRYDQKKNLWTKNPAGNKIEALVAYDYRDEARAVADKIESLCLKMDQKDYSQIAILYRAHSHKEILLEELNARGIPTTIVREKGFFEREEIRDLIAYMRIVDNPEDSVSLFRVLTLPLWNIDIEDLIYLAGTAKKEGLSIYHLLKRIDNIPEISDGTKKQLSDFGNHFKKLLRISKREDVTELIRNILLESGYLKRLTSEESMENKQKILNISSLNNFIIKYIKNNSDWSPSAFLEYLNCFSEAGGEPRQISLLRKDNAVQLMTIHAAKGLEFPYVFLISLVRNRFPTVRRKEPIPFPDLLMKEERPEGDFHREEERRLCYVGMTRSQKGLYLSSVNNATTKPSVFLGEIITEEATELGDAIYSEIQPEEDLSKRAEAFVDRYKELEKSKNLEYKLPRPSKLSFSQIDTYKKCPMQYKFAYIYRIPGRKRAALTFGSVVHSALEDFFKQVQERKAVNEKTLLDLYRGYWVSNGYDSKMQENAYKSNGRESLKTFFKNNKDILKKPPLYLEKRLDLKIGDSLLDVRIDRIDSLGGNDVEIIDYKTGKLQDKKILSKNLQLDIYAIACKEILNLNPRLLSFYYIKPNQKVTTVKSDEQLEGSKEIIIETANLIESEAFDPKPSRLCKWCDYFALCPAYDKR